jgi:addiction module HigA family antidote
MTDYKAKRDPARDLVHPGEILREDILPSPGMSVVAAARAPEVSRQTLHRILADKASVTPEMALRLGKFCGNGPDVWLRLQESFDLWHARRALADELAKIKTARAAL